MEKAFVNFTWRNEPRLDTPINETNLNKINNGLNTVDNRVIVLDTSKANQSDLLQTIKTVTYNTETGLFTFTYWNGNIVTVDLNIEKIPVSFSMSSNGVITMTTTDGTQYSCDVSTLIKTYNFETSSDIRFNVVIDSNGNRTITAFLVDGSVTASKLNPDYLAEIVEQVEAAEAAADDAHASANSASYDASLSRSYAIGGSGVREGENTDNSKYYKEQAEAAATAAAQSLSDTQDVYSDTVEKYEQTSDLKDATQELFTDTETAIQTIMDNAYAGATTDVYIDLTTGEFMYQSGVFDMMIDEDDTSATFGDLLWEVRA